jgi:protein-S-isoprenylcysteine O-methyltransferase Ste14
MDAKYLLAREFESRIFISLGIVAVACALSTLSGTVPVIVLLGRLAGLDDVISLRVGFLALSAVMLLASLLRMWAGTELTARRVMAFKVQADQLTLAGPYLLVRNPIYLADFVALCGFSLCLSPAGLCMPILFLLHYLRLIAYEEKSLGVHLAYQGYADAVPRLFPSLLPFVWPRGVVSEFHISRGGFRHNALYILFIPGFLVAAYTGEFLHAAYIGLPGVLDWAIIHTRIGLHS